MNDEFSLTPEEQQIWDSIDVSTDLDDQLPTESSTTEDETTEQPKNEDSEIQKPEVETVAKPEPNQVVTGPTEGETTETPIEQQAEKPVSKKFKIKARNRELEFDEADVVQLASKGIDYTYKMQKLKPYRKAVSAMEQAGLSDEDINLYIDMKNGKKEAVSKFIKDNKIDLMELDTEEQANQYQMNDYGYNEQEQELQEVLDELSSSPYVNELVRITDSEWDSESRARLYQQPALLKQLEADVKSGMYEVVQKEAQRQKIIDGGRRPDIDYYASTYQGFLDYLKAHPLQENTPVTKPILQVQKTDPAKTREQRKAATPIKNSVMPSIAGMLGEDLNDIKLPSDKEYEQWKRENGIE